MSFRCCSRLSRSRPRRLSKPANPGVDDDGEPQPQTRFGACGRHGHDDPVLLLVPSVRGGGGKSGRLSCFSNPSMMSCRIARVDGCVGFDRRVVGQAFFNLLARTVVEAFRTSLFPGLTVGAIDDRVGQVQFIRPLLQCMR